MNKKQELREKIMNMFLAYGYDQDDSSKGYTEIPNWVIEDEVIPYLLSLFSEAMESVVPEKTLWKDCNGCKAGFNEAIDQMRDNIKKRKGGQ